MAITVVTEQPLAFLEMQSLFDIEFLTDPGTHRYYFLHRHPDLFLCVGQVRLLIDLDVLFPRDPVDHVLVRYLSKYRDFPVIDTTGGLGRDSLLALYAGNNVLTYERDPWLFFALYWLRGLVPLRGNHWEIRYADACEHRESGGIWLVDPMFPKDDKRAQVQKYMQIVRAFAGESDAEDRSFLMRHARSHADIILHKAPRSKKDRKMGLWFELRR